MTAAMILDELATVNRAYQVLFALGETSWTVRTLTVSEAEAIVAIVQDLAMGRCETILDRMLYHLMTPTMLEYVSGGLEL